jgi:hypothetical protein
LLPLDCFVATLLAMTRGASVKTRRTLSGQNLLRRVKQM